MPSEITVFAETNFRNQRRRFGVKVDDRRRHMYVVGKTGMGKSTLLENMVVTDIRAGHGLAVVDPHGDLAEKILSFVPNERINDVIYFNPCDTTYPIAFNILETIGPEYKHLVAYGLVGVFKKIWADSWGPRMEYIMTNTILALLDYPGSTLLGVMRMLVDKAYRKKVVSKVTDPVIKTFWADEFANYSEKFRTEAIAPIQNKIGQFLASSIIRNIVGQSKSTIEMRTIMDERKILIMNLAKGRIGEENSALLGAMMITKLQIAAMSRVDIPEEERKDFYLYVDEFQNFATDSFAGILSEARKYRLCLIMAHQYFEQLNDVVKAAVFGNVGTILVFRVGATDAAELELEFAPQFLPADIVNLKKYTFCIRLMVDGVATEPFSAIGLPPVSGTTDNTDKVIRVSRERYARPQNLVEDRIIRWSGVEVMRPQGQTTQKLNANEFNDNDFGDDDPVQTDAATTSQLPDESEKISSRPLAQSTNPQLSKAEADKNDNKPLGVDLSKFIPGESANGMTQTTSAKVQLAHEINASELAVGSIQTSPGNRPKINFTPVTQPSEPEAVIPVPITNPVTASPAVMTKPTPNTTAIQPASVQAPAPAVQTKPAVIQPVISPVVKTVVNPPAAMAKSNNELSLKTLHAGTAPQVFFKGQSRTASSAPETLSPASSFPSPVISKPAIVQTPPLSSVAPKVSSSPTLSKPGSILPSTAFRSNQTVSNMSGAKKRKRNRKRKPGQQSGGGSGVISTPNQSPFSQNRPLPSSQPQRQPVTQNQMSSPRVPQTAPAATPATPIVRPLPSQIAPPQPPKPVDTTKVSLKDLV